MKMKKENTWKFRVNMSDHKSGYKSETLRVVSVRSILTDTQANFIAAKAIDHPYKFCTTHGRDGSCIILYSCIWDKTIGACPSFAITIHDRSLSNRVESLLDNKKLHNSASGLNFIRIVIFLPSSKFIIECEQNTKQKNHCFYVQSLEIYNRSKFSFFYGYWSAIAHRWPMA